MCPASCCEICPLVTCGSASIGATEARTTASAGTPPVAGSRSVTCPPACDQSVGEAGNPFATAREPHRALDRPLQGEHGNRLHFHRRARVRLRRRHRRRERENYIAIDGGAGGRDAPK